MNKFFTFLLFPCLFFAQDISLISVGDGGSIAVTSGAKINIAGLELTPSSDLVISETDIGRTSTPVGSNNNASTNRVYTSTSLISDFTGTVVFNYNEDDIIVFYPEKINEYNQLIDTVQKHNISFIKAKNPYWNENGKMILDPDGYRIIISNLKCR